MRRRSSGRRSRPGPTPPRGTSRPRLLLLPCGVRGEYPRSVDRWSIRAAASGPHPGAERRGEGGHVPLVPHPTAGQGGHRLGERSPANVRRDPPLVPAEDAGGLGHADQLRRRRRSFLPNPPDALARPLVAPLGIPVLVGGGRLGRRPRLDEVLDPETVAFIEA